MQDKNDSVLASELLAVNQAFYDAFGAGSYDVMESLWARKPEVSVIHPGAEVIHGRREVLDSWRLILQAGQESRMNCKSPRAFMHEAFAYVTCIEAFPEGELTATNIFIREEGEWRMVHHQAGPLTVAEPGEDRILH